MLVKLLFKENTAKWTKTYNLKKLKPTPLGDGAQLTCYSTQQKGAAFSLQFFRWPWQGPTSHSVPVGFPSGSGLVPTLGILQWWTPFDHSTLGTQRPGGSLGRNCLFFIWFPSDELACTSYTLNFSITVLSYVKSNKSSKKRVCEHVCVLECSCVCLNVFIHLCVHMYTEWVALGYDSLRCQLCKYSVIRADTKKKQTTNSKHEIHFRKLLIPTSSFTHSG